MYLKSLKNYKIYFFVQQKGNFVTDYLVKWASSICECLASVIKTIKFYVSWIIVTMGLYDIRYVKNTYG